MGLGALLKRWIELCEKRRNEALSTSQSARVDYEQGIIVGRLAEHMEISGVQAQKRLETACRILFDWDGR